MAILQSKACADYAGDIQVIGNNRFICAYTAISSLDAGKPVMITTGPELTYGYTPVAIAPAQTDLNVLIGVRDKAISAAGWYWFQIKGLCNAYVLGAAGIVVGAGLQVTAAATNFTVDFSTGEPSPMGSTVAVNKAIYTTTTAALKSVYLTGLGGTIDPTMNRGAWPAGSDA